MYNLKDKSSLILLSGVVSYLYLFSSLLNKKYNIIFIYFTILFAGYFIIGSKIFLYNLLIIIFDILNKKFIIREGNYDQKFEAGKQKAKNNSKFNKDESSIELDGMSEDDGKSEDDGNELADKLDAKDQDNQRKKEAGEVDLQDDGSKNNATSDELIKKDLRM
jgi:hypothetical protein|tara:strand:- start:511 stop:999 length:489 start_codon:yes stop_codon:yes gene_type:complete